MRRQEIFFDGEKCLLLSFRDVTPSHILDKAKEESALLKKLHMTISKDLIDPLSLIATSAKYIIRKQKARSNQSLQIVNKEKELENLYNILVASKLSLFKCKDLLEINAGNDEL